MVHKKIENSIYNVKYINDKYYNPHSNFTKGLKPVLLECKPPIPLSTKKKKTNFKILWIENLKEMRYCAYRHQ